MRFPTINKTPMIHFTLEELVNFTLNEKKMVEDVMPTTGHDEDIEPGEQALRNILDYSKALSVRKSKTMKRMHFVLN